MAFCSALQKRTHPTWICKTPPSPIEKLIPNQSDLALTARTWTLQNCMSLNRKTKQALRVGLGFLSNSFILNNLAERVRLDFCHLAQVVARTRHSNKTLCLCCFQALSQLRVRCLSRPRTTSFDHKKGITGITLVAESEFLSASFSIFRMLLENSKVRREGVSHHFVRSAVSERYQGSPG